MQTLALDVIIGKTMKKATSRSNSLLPQRVLMFSTLLVTAAGS